MTTETATSSPRPCAHLDALIEDWERLQVEANEIIDQYVAELREIYPGVPASVLRSRAITNRAGSALNVAAAMRLIRQILKPEAKMETRGNA
jgi:hypothetical protein